MEDVKETKNKQEKKGPHRFQPGESGNPNGRPKGSISITSAFKKRLREKSKENRENLLEFIDIIWEMAIKDKNEAMLRLIWNYVDGLPKQGVKFGLEDNLEGVKIEIIKKEDETEHPRNNSSGKDLGGIQKKDKDSNK